MILAETTINTVNNPIYIRVAVSFKRKAPNNRTDPRPLAEGVGQDHSNSLAPSPKLVPAGELAEPIKLLSIFKCPNRETFYS